MFPLSTAGAIFLNMLTAFTGEDPKNAKKAVKSSVFFKLMGVHAKAAHKMLVKSTPGLNFINILSSTFYVQLFHSWSPKA